VKLANSNLKSTAKSGVGLWRVTGFSYCLLLLRGCYVAASSFSRSYSSFFFTRTTVILAKPSAKDGGLSLAAMRRITSSGTTRSRR